jgi:tetratricopeptide (TPR) repeat protein
MEEQNSISIRNDGSSITIHDAGIGNVTLQPERQEEAHSRLQQLDNTQIAYLMQIFELHKQEVSEQFKSLLKDVARKKNVVEGNITNVRTVRMGDEIRYYFYPPGAKLPKELTLSLPKINPADLIGRENDLEQLHELLSKEKRVVVVNGLGGVGKTTLAQAYASKYYDDYEHIVWITQKSESIENDFINTEGLLTSFEVKTDTPDREQLFKEIILKLKAIEERPNLLVIDNAEQSLSNYRHLLPGQPNWHLLVTSREELDEFYLKRLGFLSLGQAVELFKKHYTIKKLTDEDIRELVQAVDYHTLTIEILAKTAKAQRYGLAQLKQAIEQDLRANIKVGRQSGRVERIGSYLITVFNLSGLNNIELWLLKQFVCLPPEFHTYDLVYELAVSEESPYGELFSETISGLTGKGWLLYNQETDSYKMHRIIAEVVKKQHQISVDDVSDLMDTITSRLDIDQSIDNPVEKFPWIPFGESILELFQDSRSGRVEFLQNTLALVLHALGDYTGARVLLEKVIQLEERNFGLEHPSVAVSYSSLALVLRDLGDYKGARDLLEKAVQLAERHYGPEHPTTAINYSNLAVVLKDLGDDESARTLLEKAVQLAERHYGPEHPFTAIRYSNLGLALGNLGDYEGARVLLEKAVKLDEKHFGTEHPSTAIAYSHLGLALKNLGDYKGAKALLEKALQSNETNFGPEHRSTVVVYSNLAGVCKELGDYERARALLEKALQSNKTNFGPEHPFTGDSYSALGGILWELGDYEGARALLEKALQLNESNFGPEHSFTATSYSNLAVLLKDLEDHEGARALLEKAVYSDESNFGPEHPSTARSYSNLAVVLKESGEYERALDLSERALNIYTRILPEGHPYIIRTLDIYASIKELLQNS